MAGDDLRDPDTNEVTQIGGQLAAQSRRGSQRPPGLENWRTARLDPAGNRGLAERALGRLHHGPGRFGRFVLA